MADDEREPGDNVPGAMMSPNTDPERTLSSVTCAVGGSRGLYIARGASDER